MIVGPAIADVHHVAGLKPLVGAHCGRKVIFPISPGHVVVGQHFVGIESQLWPQEMDELDYLYALGIAAGEVKNTELEQRALGRLLEVGQNSPEVHLFMGKAYINGEKYDEALTELNLAAQANPKLPFVHFNLGFAYLKKQNLEHAEAEFLADIAVEPAVPYNYEQLGLLCSQQQKIGRLKWRCCGLCNLIPEESTPMLAWFKSMIVKRNMRLRWPKSMSRAS